MSDEKVNIILRLHYGHRLSQSHTVVVIDEAIIDDASDEIVNLRADNEKLREANNSSTGWDTVGDMITGDMLAFLANHYSGEGHEDLWTRVTTLLEQIEWLCKQTGTGQTAKENPNE